MRSRRATKPIGMVPDGERQPGPRDRATEGALEGWQGRRIMGLNEGGRQAAQRWVIKVGSSLVTRDGQGVDRAAIDAWSDQIAAMRARMAAASAGQARGEGEHPRILPEIVLVSSGAIAEGVRRLGWSRRPREVRQLQAAAAIGQMGIAQAYESSFSRHGIVTAQVLLTHEDLADRRRYLNARSMLRTLLALGVVPIVNENDSVVTDEIKGN